MAMVGANRSSCSPEFHTSGSTAYATASILLDFVPHRTCPCQHAWNKSESHSEVDLEAGWLSKDNFA